MNKERQPSAKSRVYRRRKVRPEIQDRAHRAMCWIMVSVTGAMALFCLMLHSTR